MAILKIWPLFLLSHLLLHGLILAQPADFRSCNNDIGNYTKNSTFQNNLNTLLSSLSSNIDPYGFYNASIGQINDKVSAVVLCRGDVLLEDCRRCVNSIAQGLVNHCPNQKEAFGFHDECILQYSSGSIIGSTYNSPIIYWYNEENATRPVEFYLELKKLLEKLRGQAANGPNNQFKKYASDSSNQTVYALVQCTPDLSPQSCTDCLTEAYGKIPNCTCNGKRGGRIIGPRCNFRYESNPFFEEVVSQAPLQPPSSSPPPPPLPPPPPPPPGKDDGTTRTVVIVVVTIVTVLILIVSVSLLMKRRRKKKPVNEIEN